LLRSSAPPLKAFWCHQSQRFLRRNCVLAL